MRTDTRAVPGGAHPVSSGCDSIATGDFNGDGRIDLVTTSNGHSSLSVLLAHP
jgi:hypothetical protein